MSKRHDIQHLLMSLSDGEEAVISGRHVHREDVLGIRGAPVYRVEGFPELTLMQAVDALSNEDDGGDV